MVMSNPICVEAAYVANDNIVGSDIIVVNGYIPVILVA